jgi:SpoVK/Ycf46/Vps4 family AAA+-type ATPase
MLNDDSLKMLKEAVKLSPDNAPLRTHLAESLVSAGRFDEAAAEFTASLALTPKDGKCRLGLANCFYQLGEYSKALVVVEDLLSVKDAPGKAHVLYARLLLNEGKLKEARQHYNTGVASDPTSCDMELSTKLQSTTVEPSAKRWTERTSDNDDMPMMPERGRRSDALHNSDVEKSDIDFSQVGGMTDVKEQIRIKIIYPLTHAETFKAYGKKAGGGMLLYGPPGCGKTHLARATAGEIDAGFISVGIDQVLEYWIGQSEKNLHETFERARRNTPCVLFFDEVDALGAKRADLRHSGLRQMINQFLLEMDGMQSSNESILILAATNAPWELDSAFRRPGRFDRVIFVPPPDNDARGEILRIMLHGKPVENIDFNGIAKKTDKFSGADIMALVDIAVEKKIEDAMKNGVPKPILTKDLEQALKEIKPSTAEWFATARNYALYSNASGAYDDILKYLKLS